MKNNVKELLPIGSVVLLKGATKKVMVFGVKQVDSATDIEYDYLGVVYPEGNLGEGSSFFFAHDQIDKVFHRGYEDAERDAFIQRLKAYYDSKPEEE